MNDFNFDINTITLVKYVIIIYITVFVLKTIMFFVVVVVFTFLPDLYLPPVIKKLLLG